MKMKIKQFFTDEIYLNLDGNILIADKLINRLIKDNIIYKK